MIPPSIYGYLIIAALVVSAFVGTYLKGRFDGRRVCNQKIQELMIESTTREQAAMRQANDAATKLETAHARIEIKYRTITKEVERVVDRPLYVGVCLDGDGVRLANAALTGSRPIAPESSHAMSESSGTR